MQAKDIMKKHVVTVTPDMTTREVAKLFSDRHISGAPVVDRQGHLAGIISQTDLVRHEREAGAQEVPAYHEEESLNSKGFHVEDPDMTRVDRVMTPWTISCEENAPILDLAQQMLKRHIHRVVVTRGSKLVGIVTSMDMLQALLSLAEEKKIR